MQTFAITAVLIAAVACSGDRARSGHRQDKPAERTCDSADDCAPTEICRGPDGCEMASTCQSEVTCGGHQATLCGCDGVTFQADQDCAGRPVFRHSACEALARCERDGKGPDCDEPAGPCPPGRVREYVKGCWESCVPIDICECATDADCPKLAPRCDTARGRCATS